ncbi:unnamed protein product [Penicillium pancosmium]
MGWLIGFTPHTWGPIDISDVESDPVAQWQQRYYLTIYLIMGSILPAFIAYFGWGDLHGGFWYAGWARVFVDTHMVFFVNSLAHCAC